MTNTADDLLGRHFRFEHLGEYREIVVTAFDPERGVRVHEPATNDSRWIDHFTWRRYRREVLEDA